MSDSDSDSGSSSGEEEEKKVIEDCSSSAVVTKYRAAGDIANQALAHVINACVPGAVILELCKEGDRFIEEKCAAIFQKKKIQKGVSFPTCVSVNHICGHYSPLNDNKSILSYGDVVKVDLGAHIDGFSADVAHTIVLPEEQSDEKKEQVISGKKADVVLAAHYAAEAALRLLQIGKKNRDITQMFANVGKSFECKPLPRIYSYEIGKNITFGEKKIISHLEYENKEVTPEECEFGLNEAWVIDVLYTTGEGIPRESDDRCSIYCNNPSYVFILNLKASRKVFSHISEKHPVFPFNLRDIDDTRFRFGLKECLERDLVKSYPVLHEREGSFVAHFKFTALLIPGGTLRITGIPFDTSKYHSEFEITDDNLTSILSKTTKRKSGKNRKKKNKKKKGDTVIPVVPNTSVSIPTPTTSTQ